MNYKNFYILFFVLLTTTTLGCGHIVEFSRKFWGSSIQTLDAGRKNAVRKTFRCSFDESFDKVLAMTKAAKTTWASTEVDTPVVETTEDATKVTKDTPAEPAKKYLDLFQQNRRKQVIVVMGVPNAIDTTEVGIFFTPLEQNLTTLEFSSLSTTAKIKAAEVVTEQLIQSCPEVTP